ncbi:carbonic anhydrase family protein [Kosakonia sp. BYX6]|uniref:Carbonic anhydrase n=1 Tax=Kosakonia calanthes TaxID=3139408 RepID=A0ABZ3B6G7_9ENTR
MKLHIAKTAIAMASLVPLLAWSAHWGYEGKGSPEHWGELSSEFITCQNGKNQSPINIDKTLTAHLTSFEYHYRESPALLLNNGHTIQASFLHNTNTLILDGETSHLQQFHFHAPSENTIHSQHYPLEMHLVHTFANGDIAVIAVMFELGAANQELAELWQKLPIKVESSEPIQHRIDLAALLPVDKSYWRFSGSLTTPPCSEGVTWLVMKHPLTISSEQLAQFTSVIHHNNNRPLQPLHGRLVVE